MGEKLAGILIFCRLRSSGELSFLDQLPWCVLLKNKSVLVKTAFPLFSICAWLACAGSFRFGMENLSCTTKPRARRCCSLCLRDAVTQAMGRWGMKGKGDAQIASGTFWIQPKTVPCNRCNFLGLMSFQGVFRKRQPR